MMGYGQHIISGQRKLSPVSRRLVICERNLTYGITMCAIISGWRRAVCTGMVAQVIWPAAAARSSAKANIYWLNTNAALDIIMHIGDLRIIYRGYHLASSADKTYTLFVWMRRHI
jgi:hypothetical protein